MLRQSFPLRMNGLPSLKSLILFSEITRAKAAIMRMGSRQGKDKRKTGERHISEKSEATLWRRRLRGWKRR